VTDLPTPTTTRWQPLRLGLVDLFYYDNQEFWFRDGRLLLRGNNGTGKSKVLALTLPFLLDGDLTPSRVEPDGDRGKRMEWNLLLGGAYEERIGYTWLELGRVAEDGERCYLTIGCGLKAVAGRGIADRWYFLTAQRPGDDLFLIGPSGTVLTKDRLTAALDGHGQVMQRAEQYRRALDEHLFHLGQERYEALVNLLIQLRQPQLSKQPKEDVLSRALSEALAPLDQAILADIAASFHDLEQQRDELAGLRDTRGHVTRFMQRYRHYARVAARRQGRELRGAQSAYDELGRQLGAVGEEIRQARADEAEAAAALAGVEGELVVEQAAREELAGRPELKHLDDAQRLVDHTVRARDTAREAAERADARRDQRRDRHDEAYRAAEGTRGEVLAALAAADAMAQSAGVGSAHHGSLAALVLPDGPEGTGYADAAVGSVGTALAELARRRREEAGHVLQLAEEAAAHHAAVLGRRRALDDREAERDGAADRVDTARETVEAQAADYVTGWQRYAEQVTELALPMADELGLVEWTLALDGDNPATVAARRAQANSHQVLARAAAAAQQQLDAATQGLTAKQDERRRLEAGETSRPPVPYTRAEGAREDRPGAPLWTVVDFAPHLSDTDRAGVEAALEAAGLLDAWIAPDGRLLDPDTHDTLLTIGAPAAASLATVLHPAIGPDAGMPPDAFAGTVAAVLAGIGYGESDAPAWIDVRGRWRLGPLTGAWRKPAPEYVGAGAREQARRRRLAALAGEIADAEALVADARARVEQVEVRQRTLAAELAAAPSDEPLREAHVAATAAARALTEAAHRVEAERTALAGAEMQAREANRVRDEAAVELHTPIRVDDLRALLTAVTDYRAAAATLVAELRRHNDRLTVVRTWADELRTAETDVAEAQATLAEAREAAQAAQSRLDTLGGSIGATVEELRARLAATTARIGDLKAEADRLTRRNRAATERRAKAEGREEQLHADLERETVRRNDAVRAFQRFAATGLLAVAAPELDAPDSGGEWAADPTVRLARRAEPLLSEVDDSDDAWRRVQDDIARRHTDLAEALSRHGHHAVAGLEDGLFVATVVFQGRSRTPGELVDALTAEVDYRERMLSAKERELIEEHLINDVASSLHELIADAEEQLQAMNRELDERPTSTGMRLRLRWEPRPDAPTGLAEARGRLLRQAAELWSAEDRKAVGDFLQRQIEEERSRDEYGTWSEHLRRALDYRAWHRFVIERWQDGRWRPATGPASGGERVLAVSLPLFAAASGHYRSAHPHAPRLVLLDEAFAGVDDDARAKCLGLLAHFDLDVVMTSEREWGFYATVPGIATHQLVRRDGIDAVHVTTWEWDGVAAREVDRPTALAPAQPQGATDADGLW